MADIRRVLLYFVVLMGLLIHSAHAAFVFMDGGTCVPGTLFGNNCLSSSFFASQPGGLSLVPVISADGNSISGMLDDGRFAFTTGSTAFLRGSASLASGQIRIEANSIEGTSQLFAALRATIGDTLHLHGPTDADGIDDGLYSITFGLTANGTRATDFTNPSSLIFFSSIGLDLLLPISGTICSSAINLPNLTGGDAANFNETIQLNCDVPAEFRFLASMSSGRISDGFFDGGHTGQISISLPAGVTFTSDSGVLLSQIGPTPGIPEPGSLALLGIALAGLGLSRRSYTNRAAIGPC